MADATCAVAGCDRTGPLKRGWCGGHYRRWQRHGDVGPAELGIPKPKPGPCTVEGCGKPISCRKLCKAHLHRLDRYGDVQADRPIQTYRPRGTGGTCTVDDCGLPTQGRYCAGHAARMHKHGDALADIPLRRRGVPKPDVECAVADCERLVQSIGLCGGHYHRQRRTGETGEADIKLLRRAKPGETCLVEGCTRKPRSAGWCKAHYSRWQRSGDIRAEKPISLPAAELPDRYCTITGCARPHYGNDWCFLHYQSWHRYGNPLGRQPFKSLNPKHAAARERHRVMMANTTKSDRQLITAYKLAIRNDPCRYCGQPSKHADHYFPVARGGSWQWWALVPACAACNQSKSARCGTWFALRGDEDRARRVFPLTSAAV